MRAPHKELNQPPVEQSIPHDGAAETLLIEHQAAPEAQTVEQNSFKTIRQSTESLATAGIIPVVVVDDSQEPRQKKDAAVEQQPRKSLSAAPAEQQLAPPAVRIIQDNRAAEQNLENEDLKTPGNLQRELEVGRLVLHNGEQLRIAGRLNEHTVLFDPAKRDHAVIGKQVTSAEIAANYAAVSVHTGKEKSLVYVDKRNPGAGASVLIELEPGRLLLMKEARIELVKTKELISGLANTTDRTPVKAEPRVEAGTVPAGEQQQRQRRTDTTNRANGATEATNRADQRTDRAVQSRDTGYGAMEGANLRRAEHARYGVVEERERRLEGASFKVRIPLEDQNKHIREVQVNEGPPIKLERNRFTQIWFYSDATPGHTLEQVKLHVTGLNAEDVAKLQKELLPELEKMRAAGDVSLYKTFDPNFMDADWTADQRRVGAGPASKGQLSKAFTIYLPTDKAEKVASAIDKLLAEKKLGLDEHYTTDTVGDATRSKTTSKRVSVERDLWPVTVSQDRRTGALLDNQLSEKLTKEFSKYGVAADGKLSPAALEQIETKAGLRRGQLDYDLKGRLMFVSADRSGPIDGENYYADEHRAIREKGQMTGRPALYALYRSADLEPAEIRIAEQRASKNISAPVLPDRRVPDADRLRRVETHEAKDGTIERKPVAVGGDVNDGIARKVLNAEEIDSIRTRIKVLENSEKDSDRRVASDLQRTLRALEGEFGPEIQKQAHRNVIDLARKMQIPETRRGFNTSAAISGAVLVSAGLAWIRSESNKEEAPERAKFGK